MKDLILLISVGILLFLSLVLYMLFSSLSAIISVSTLAMIAGLLGRGIEEIPKSIVWSIVDDISPIKESKRVTTNEL